MKDKLAIVGSHPRTRGQFDFNREDCDIVVFNEAVKTETNSGFAPRADYVLQLHDEAIWKNPQNRNDPNHYEWLKAGNTPAILMQDVYPDVPKSEKFPKDEVLKDRRRYVTCSPAWVLAWAIYKGYKAIEIYGVELASNTEYHHQQGSFKYWLGFAEGRGIKVDIYSEMFNAPLYGYEGEVEIPYADLEKRINELQPDSEKYTARYLAVKIGAEQAVKTFEQGDNSDKVMKALADLLQAGHDLGYIDGAIQENKRYKGKADEMIGASGKFIFSRQEFESSAARLQNDIADLEKRHSAIGGQLDLLHANVVKAAKTSPKRKKVMDAYLQTLGLFVKSNNSLAVLRGAAAENHIYMRRLDAGIKAAGGEKSEEAIHASRL